MAGGRRKKSLKPSRKRDWVPELMQRFGASERQALRMVRMSASLYRYRLMARDASGLKLRIKEITDTRVHYGYRRVHVLLRREGYKDNVKRVYRIYREAGLSLRLITDSNRIAANLGGSRRSDIHRYDLFASLGGAKMLGWKTMPRATH